MLIVCSAQAQRGGQRGQRGQRMDPEKMAQTQAERFQEEFGLSDEQYKKTYEVLLSSAKARNEKLQELRASGDRTGMRSAIEEIQEENDKKLKEIFSKSQWEAYEKWKKENVRQRGGRRGGGN